MRESRLKSLILQVMNRFALRVAVDAANSACDWIFFQEELPEELKKLRKF